MDEKSHFSHLNRSLLGNLEACEGFIQVWLETLSSSITLSPCTNRSFSSSSSTYLLISICSSLCSVSSSIIIYYIFSDSCWNIHSICSHSLPYLQVFELVCRKMHSSSKATLIVEIVSVQFHIIKTFVKPTISKRYFSFSFS